MHLKGRHGRVIAVAVSLVGTALIAFLLYTSANPLSFLPISYYYNYRSSPTSFLVKERENLEGVLKNASASASASASTKGKTVIITTLNSAWAESKSKSKSKSMSMLDLFLKSFRIGNKTTQLLDNLLIVGLDQKAYERCMEVHPHCYQLKTQGSNFSGEAYFMTSDYLHMMWRRIEFLGLVLELGYDFVFTDVDIMWLQDPFQHFYEEGDFQIACDFFWGKPEDLENKPNGGFNYVKSNEKTIKFYRFWHNARLKFPGLHDQDVLNKIKFDPFLSQIGIKIRFLDTAYYGGFCQPSMDLNLVCTMHANCCIGQDNKVHDLRLLLQDWEKFFSLPPHQKRSPPFRWSVPQSCKTSFDHRHLLAAKRS